MNEVAGQILSGSKIRPVQYERSLRVHLHERYIYTYHKFCWGHINTLVNGSLTSIKLEHVISETDGTKTIKKRSR